MFSFQVGGNLDDLLSDIENLSQDIYQLQLKNKNYHSDEQINFHPDILTAGPTTLMSSQLSPSLTSMQQQMHDINNKKPFRSEINLVLSIPPPLSQQHQIMNTSPDTPQTPPSFIGFENYTSGPKYLNLQPHQRQYIRRNDFLRCPSASLNELRQIKNHSKDMLHRTPSIPTTPSTPITPSTTNGSSTICGGGGVRRSSLDPQMMKPFPNESKDDKVR